MTDTAGTSTETGGVVGTVAYLAPERLQDQPASPASDIYSLGCLLWVLLMPHIHCASGSGAS